ncbi:MULTISPECIES: UTRA domain-containing protein [unclassified Streptomyces]|uniref:UTRA domain-containing protein n=1 Tax=unclassified Streptomyces TaxID=2593676 RepID=UPI003811E7E5
MLGRGPGAGGGGLQVHHRVPALRGEGDVLRRPGRALLFERLTSDTTGRPVEYVHSLYRGDRYRIVSRLALGPAAEVAPDREGHHPGIPPGDFAHGDAITSSTRGDIQAGA